MTQLTDAITPIRTISLVSLPLIVLLLVSCESKQNELRLIAPFAPVDRAITEEVSGLLGDMDATSLNITGTADSEEAALDAVASGVVDIALISNSLSFRNNIATVMPLYQTVLHIAYREERNASSGITLLSGAKIYAGPTGSASRLIFERIVNRIGLERSAYEYVSEITDHPDIVIVFAPISPEIFIDYPDFRLFSLGSPGAIGIGSVVDAAVLLNPHFRPFVIPAGTYGVSTPEPVVTIAVDKMLVTRSDMDSSIVYDLIDDVLRLRPALAAQRPGLFQQLSENFDASRSRFVLHAGTQAYLQRSEPTLLERYSGVAEVAVTLIIALASALIAGARIFRMRRKNRIDEFYSRTIELSRSVNRSTSVEKRQQVIEEVRDLQMTAFDLLVAEKLAADESFRIFITLSNDVVKELRETGTS